MLVLHFDSKHCCFLQGIVWCFHHPCMKFSFAVVCVHVHTCVCVRACMCVCVCVCLSGCLHACWLPGCRCEQRLSVKKSWRNSTQRESFEKCRACDLHRAVLCSLLAPLTLFSSLSRSSLDGLDRGLLSAIQFSRILSLLTSFPLPFVCCSAWNSTIRSSVIFVLALTLHVLQPFCVVSNALFFVLLPLCVAYHRKNPPNEHS